jgi:glutaminase
MVQEIDALKTQSTKIIEAENIKGLAEIRAQAKATEILKKAQAFLETQKILADNKAEIIRLNAKNRLETAQSKAAAAITLAQAETANAQAMDPLRKFDEKMLLQKSLQKLAREGKMVVSGETGEKVLEFYNKTLKEVSER